MLVPICDKKGDLRGIIQYVNKIGRPKIPESDELEMSPVLTTLGEIIKTADEGLKITNIAAGLKIYLE